MFSYPNKGSTKQIGWIALLYLLLTVIMTWPTAKHFTDAIPGDGFDGWQNYWNLWWVKVALVERLQSPFQTDLLYAPTGVDLYFHTLNPFNGVTTLPIQLSVGLPAAYNSVVFLSWTLGGLGVFLLTRWVLRPRLSSSPQIEFQNRKSSLLPPFLAGLIFTFAPFHMAHLLGHMQVMSLQWIPFYVLYLLRTLDQRRNGQPWLRSALLAGLFLVLCGLCDWYFVLYLFFFTGLLILWHFLTDLFKRRSIMTALSTWVLPPIVAALVFLIVLSPLLIPMVETASQLSFMVRPESDFYMLSASLSDFLIPNRLHTLFRNESFGWVGNQVAPVSERTIGIGYVALLLALLGILLDRKRSGFWFGSALFFLAMALGPTMHLGNINWTDIPADPALALPAEIAAQLAPAESVGGPQSLFGLLNRLIPFMEISRSVSRYALMVQLCVAVLAGVGLARLMARFGWADERQQSSRGRLSTAVLSTGLFSTVLVALVLFEYWVAPFPISPPDTPTAYADAANFNTAEVADGDGDGRQLSILNLPMNFDRPGYLLYQTVHQQPLAVAYISRDDPRTFTERVPALQHFRHLGPDILASDPAEVGLTVFHDLGIGTVVLDRYKMPGGHERDYTIGVAEAIFAGHAPIFEDERVTIYRVPALTERKPYLALGPLNWGPLRTEGDTSARKILDGPAELWIHPGDDAQKLFDAQLEIHYWTEAGASAKVVGPKNEEVDLPTAESGEVVTIPLGKLLVESDLVPGKPVLIDFLVEAAETVSIVEVRLE